MPQEVLSLSISLSAFSFFIYTRASRSHFLPPQKDIDISASPNTCLYIHFSSSAPGAPKDMLLCDENIILYCRFSRQHTHTDTRPSPRYAFCLSARAYHHIFIFSAYVVLEIYIIRHSLFFMLYMQRRMYRIAKLSLLKVFRHIIILIIMLAARWYLCTGRSRCYQFYSHSDDYYYDLWWRCAIRATKWKYAIRYRTSL